MDNNSNDHLIISAGSLLLSVMHFMIAAENRSIVAWGIGVIAGIFSIAAACMTIRDRYLNSKLTKQKLKQLNDE